MGSNTSTTSTSTTDLTTLNNIEFYTSLVIFSSLSYLLTLGQATSVIAVLDPTNYERFANIFDPKMLQVFEAE